MIARRPCIALLFPDSGKAPHKPGKLIIPGRNAPQSPSIPQRPLETTEPETTRTTYRPPMGYFFKTQEKAEDTDEEADIMIQRLTTGSARWYVLAASLPKLNAMGYDSQLIENLTSIPKGEQSILVTAASVLQSIKLYYKEQNIDGAEGTLDYFDVEGSHFMLYELRFLDVQHRATCAEYVVKQQFNAVAMESRERELLEEYVKKGLEVAQSQSAKDQLENILGDATSEAEMKLEEKEKARIQIYRLLSQEVKYRPVPYAGPLMEVNAVLLSECPKARTSGVFSVFTLQTSTDSNGHAWAWIALPNWPPLAKAKKPVALLIKNCAQMTELRSSILAKSRDDALRLSGSGMLIVDVNDNVQSDDASYYLIDQSGQLQLSTNDDLNDKTVIGKVLFVARPPDQDSEF